MWPMIVPGRNTVQTRLLACLAGGLFGFVVASPITDGMSLNPTIALIGCPLIGVAIGYAASLLFDVFTASPDQQS